MTADREAGEGRFIGEAISRAIPGKSRCSAFDSERAATSSLPGGRAAHVEVGAFLRRGGQGPEHRGGAAQVDNRYDPTSSE
jgi:hypothetical protein